MKKIFTMMALLVLSVAFGQEYLRVSREGEKLQQYYLSLDVEHKWISGHHVVWDSGQPDMPGSVHGNKTHCSAFAAAACKKAGIYLLHPPEHGQVLLANAQYDWLQSAAGAQAGWREISGGERYFKCHQLANNGRIVVAVYQNLDHSKPGHIALIMPKERSRNLLLNEGPELIMAGTHNHNYISLKSGFSSHISSWPENEILFFAQEQRPLL